MGLFQRTLILALPRKVPCGTRKERYLDTLAHPGAAVSTASEQWSTSESVNRAVCKSVLPMSKARTFAYKQGPMSHEVSQLMAKSTMAGVWLCHLRPSTWPTRGAPGDMLCGVDVEGALARQVTCRLYPAQRLGHTPTRKGLAPRLPTLGDLHPRMLTTRNSKPQTA